MSTAAAPANRGTIASYVMKLEQLLEEKEREVGKLQEQLHSADLGWIGWQEKHGEELVKREAAELRIKELTQSDPCWYDLSTADAFRMWAADRKRLKEVEAALVEMVKLWERVHPGVILGRPTLNQAKAVLTGKGKEVGVE